MGNNESEKVIHTGLYGERAFKILSACREAHAGNCWLGNSQVQFKSSIVTRAPDGEIIFMKNSRVYNALCYSIWYKSNNEALKWIGVALKTYVREHNEGITWKRTSLDNVNIKFYEHDLDGNRIKTYAYDANGIKTDVTKEKKLTATVAEIYYIYDRLLQRQKLDKKYDKGLIDMMVGTPNDPITTEIEITRREELKKLDEQLRNDLNAIDAKFQQEHENISKKFYEEERILRAQKNEEIKKRQVEYERQKEALTHQYEQMTSMVA